MGKGSLSNDMRRCLGNCVTDFEDSGLITPARTSSLSIEFEVDGKPKTIVFERAPLGMGFMHTCPFKVARVMEFSQSQRLGVLLEWKIVCVEGVDVQAMDWAEVVKLIAYYERSLPK